MLIDYNTIVNKISAELDNKVVHNQLIASNIANVDTPGYKAKDLKFERVIKEELGHLGMKTTHPMHMKELAGGIVNNEVVSDPNPGRPDGNNVNIDDQMLKLTENNIQYNVAVQLLAKRFQHLKTALQESK